MQSDGKIVVAGDSYNGTNSDFALVRYLADGTLDTSFGSDGKVITDFGSQDGSQALAIQAPSAAPRRSEENKRAAPDLAVSDVSAVAAAPKSSPMPPARRKVEQSSKI